jgi:hypothetical protein
MSNNFGNQVIVLTGIYTSNKDKPGVYCKTLVNYLNNHAEELKKVRDPYHNSNILHLLASNDPYGDMEKELLSEWGGTIKLAGACSYIPCRELNHIIHETIVCIKKNLETLNVFLDAMVDKTTEKNYVDMKSKTLNKTPFELMNDYDVTKKITVDGNLYNIKDTLGEIFNRIDPNSTHTPTPTPSPTPTPTPTPTPALIPTPTPVSVTTPATPNDELEIFHDTNDPIHIDKSDNRGLATLVTSILKGLGNPNTNKPIMKGGAPDDGLASLIVSVLKALSNKDAAVAAPTASASPTGNGSKNSSLFGFGKKTPGDPTDLLINDILDIILNIANNEPLPKEEGNMKAKLLSGIGSLTSAFGSLMPKAVSPTSPEKEIFVPVYNKKCVKPGHLDPIAMFDKDCISSEGEIMSN